jgi:ATP-dependent Clp endopeptidase proteolytic subunit ClpP
VSWYSIKAKSDDVTEVFVYEQIGEDWSGEGVTAKQFVKDFAAIKSPNISLRINSPGGSVFDGQAIANAIKRHPASVTAYIDGLAASIASVIAIAGDRCVMADNALLMVHNAWAVAAGNAADLRDMAEVLDKVDGSIVAAYVEKSGQDEEAVRAVMADETWFTADEAFAFGLIDEVGEGMRLAASFDLSRFKHPPAALVAGPDGVAVMHDDEPEPAVMHDEATVEPPAPRLRLVAGRLMESR